MRTDTVNKEATCIYTRIFLYIISGLIMVSIFTAWRIDISQSCEADELRNSLHISNCFLYADLLSALLSAVLKLYKNHTFLLLGFILWLPVYLQFRDVCPHTDYAIYPFFLALIAFLCAIPGLLKKYNSSLIYCFLFIIPVTSGLLS